MVRLSARDELSARLASRRMHSILVWGSRIFLAAGLLALVAFGTAYVQAQLYQRYLQGHFLTDSDGLGTPGGLEPIAVRFFSQNSGAPDEPFVTSAVHPEGATLPVAEPPPHLNMIGKISIRPSGSRRWSSKETMHIHSGWGLATFQARLFPAPPATLAWQAIGTPFFAPCEGLMLETRFDFPPPVAPSSIESPLCALFFPTPSRS